MPNELWFVIEEESEKSFSIVSHVDVIYDEKTVKVDNKVTFLWNKTQCVGKIRFINEDYDKCLLEAQRLNRMKRKEIKDENTFHADQPRKAAMKCKATLGQRVKSKKFADTTNVVQKSYKKISQEEKKKMENISSQRILLANQPSHDIQKRKKITAASCSSTKSKRQKIYSDSESDSVEQNRDQEIDEDKEKEQISLSSGSEEEIGNVKDKQVKKVAARLAAMLDIKLLAKLASLDSSTSLSKENFKSLLFPQNNDKNTSVQEVIHKDNVQLAWNSATKGISSLECDMSKAGPSGLSDHSNKTNNKLSSGPYHTNDNTLKVIKSDGETTLETVNNISAGTGLKEQTENSVVVEQKSQTKNSNSMFCADKSKGILIGDEVYCTAKLYTIAEESNSATKAVRRLLEGVFTLESLLLCTVSGLPPRGKGRQAYADPSSIKKFLNPAGVDAIIKKALEWQKSKHWRPKKDSTQLRGAMAVRLCEIREREQKRQSMESFRV